tara:strand:- start:400 stop:2073 length:1674 start_codon:yes stop_codon:yes gene_type:complete
VWNNAPEDFKKDIRQLSLMGENPDSMGNLGGYTRGSLKIYDTPFQKPEDFESTVHHELAHSWWDHGHGDKYGKFFENTAQDEFRSFVDNIGIAPTEYSAKYEKGGDGNYGDWEITRHNKEKGFKYPEIFYNEIHSEVSAYMLGKQSSRTKTNTDVMEKMSVAWKKLHPTFGEAFVEQEHPRDEDGKFTDKSSIRTKFDQMFKDDTKEDFKIQEDHIEKVKEWYKEAIEQKVKWQNGEEFTIGTGKNKRKITEEDFDRIIEDKKQRIKNEEDELVELHSMLDSYDDRPVIKITDSPNTQSVGIKGFKNGVGKFKGLSRGEYNGKDMVIGGIFEDDMGGTYIDSSLNKNTSELAFKNLEYVKEAWNLLPDEDRNLIHFLKFRFSNSDQKNLGSFDAGIKNGNPVKWYMLNTIKMMLSNTVKSGTGAINTLMHEIGHVKWHQIQQLSPEKTKRFTQRMREIGNITPYQKTYENAVEAQEVKNEKERNSKEYKEGTDVWRKGRDKNMAEELENQYIIYGNEAHSEFYASLHAPTLNYGHRISQDNMEKVAEAYKELHGIVD